ncbi:strictosidine synthase-like 12-like protein [Tanacetum coccineum]
MKTSVLFLANLIVWFLLLGSVLSYSTFNKLQLPPSVTSPESVAFDRGGEGPYVTVADGRILKWQGPNLGFVDFAYTSPNSPTQTDVEKLYAFHENKHGFPGMTGSIDCRKWQWAQCPQAYSAQFSSNNDVNVLRQSPVDLKVGKAPCNTLKSEHAAKC